MALPELPFALALPALGNHFRMCLVGCERQAVRAGGDGWRDTLPVGDPETRTARGCYAVITRKLIQYLP